MKKILPLFFISVLCLVAQLSAQWQTNGPYGGNIEALASNDTVIYAASRYGGIFKSTDKGASWNSIGLQNQEVFSMAISDTGLFVGTNGDLIYLYSFSNGSWAPVYSFGAFILSAQAILITPYGMFAGTTFDGLFVSTNKGITWQRANNGLSDSSIRSMTVKGSTIFAGTKSGVFISTNAGASWSAASTGLPGGSITSMAANATTVFAGTLNNGVYFSTNNGASWTQSLPNRSIEFAITLAVKDSTVYAGTNYGMLVSTDNGKNFSAKNTGLTNGIVYSITLTDTGIYAGTYGNDGIFLSTNNAASWKPVNNKLNNQAISSFATTSAGLFAGTLYSGVYFSPDNGNSWKTVTTGSLNNAVSAIASMGDNLYAATNGTGMYISTNNGVNWANINTGLTDNSPNSIAINGNHIFAGSYFHGIFLSADSGQHWARANIGLADSNINTLAANAGIIYAGTNSGVYYSVNNGGSWALLGTGMPANTIVNSLAFNGNNIYSGGSGGVYISVNNGATWAKMSTGLPVNVQVYSIAVSGNNIFAGPYDGGVYLSTDNGSNWAPVNTAFPDNPFVYTIGFAGGNLLAGTFGNSVWQRPLSQLLPCTPPAAPVNTTLPAAQTICIGSTTTLTATGTGTLGWYSAASGGTYLGGGIFTTPTLNSTTTFYVQDSTCGASVRTAVTVTVISALTPTVTITSNEASIICSGSIVAFTAAATNAGTAPAYNWKLNGVTVQSGPSANYVKLITTGTSRLGNQLTVSCVLTSNAACLTTPTATSNTIRDTILNLPVRTTVSGQSKGVCGSSTWAYHCIAVPGAVSYTWHVPLNAVINSGQGTTAVTVTFPANFDSGTVAVVGRNRCGNGTISSLTVKCSTRSGDDTETGVEEIPADETISWNVYPNPNSGQMFIDLTQTQAAPLSYKVFNLLGEVVNEYTGTEPVDYYHEQLNLSTQPAGMYFIQVRTGEAMLTRSIIVTTK